MRVPTRTLTTCIGIGVVAAAAIAIPAWAKSGDESSGESGSTERAAHVPPFGPPPTTAERRRFAKDLEEFWACMDEQDVDLPKPPAGGRGFAIPALPPPHRGSGAPHPRLPSPEDREAFETALEECGRPPFPRPPFAARLRGDPHECAAAVPRRHR